ncbi:MAG TPA: hypothetical protein VF883_25145 [Thermoanaerobaculia bacterium]
MRTLIVVAVVLALAGCRGEPVPRDYQNAPPDVSNPPQTRSDTPSAAATGQAPPQPSTGVEGTSGPYELQSPTGTTPTTTTMADTPPATTTT